jgi:hypothetical protein
VLALAGGLWLSEGYSKVSAQAIIWFSNRIPGMLDAPVTYLDGAPVSKGFTAQLWMAREAGEEQADFEPLWPVTTFRQHIAFAGYINPVAVEAPGVVVPGFSTFIARVFDGPSWEESECRGESAPWAEFLYLHHRYDEMLSGLKSFHVNCLSDPPRPRPSSNIVRNGGFEEASLDPWMWNGLHVFPPTKSIEGARFLGLSAWAYQDLETVPGQVYRLEFAARSGVLRAFWGTTELPVKQPDEWWEYQSFRVRARTSGTRLKFDGPSQLDDVSVEPLAGRPLSDALWDWTPQKGDLHPFIVNDLTFTGKEFMAVASVVDPEGGMSKVITSKDGANWVERYVKTDGLPSQFLRTVSFRSDSRGGELFIAAGSGLLLTSLDGRTWLEQYPAPPAEIRSVAHGDRIFVGVGSESDRPEEGAIFTSSLGWHWEKREIPKGTPPLHGIFHANQRFVAVGSGGVILLSSDGRNWSRQSSPTAEDLLDVAFAKGTFVAVSAGLVLTSPEGKVWSVQSAPELLSLRAITYGGGLFIAVGESRGEGANVIYSYDGLTWAPAPGAPPARAVAIGEDSAVIAGEALFQSAPFIIPPLFRADGLRRRSDGKVWVMVDAIPGEKIVVETSSDLRNWQVLEEIQIDVASFDFIDETAVDSIARFYRASPMTPNSP